jgi:choline binding protein E
MIITLNKRRKMEGKIHFLNTGHSDCIILESYGKIAMIDSAEDTDFPKDKPHLNLKGYEDIVVKYLLDNFSDENGNINIEFVLGTHCHSDHIGGFDTVINHPNIFVKTAYLKPYNEQNICRFERVRWDNTEVYNQMFDAIKKNNVELVEEFDEIKTVLGDFNIEFFNGKNRKRKIKFGENVNSVGTLVTIGKSRAFLAGDINYKAGDEKRIADKIGNVDLLKVGHHGYLYSTSFYFVKKLMPKIAIFCNEMKGVYPDVKYKLKNISHSKLYATVNSNGIIACFDGENIIVKENIM